MEPYSLEECRQFMQNLDIDYESQEKLYNAGLNSPSKIKFYNQYEDINRLIDFTVDIFNKLTYITPIDIIQICSTFQDRYEIGKPDPVMLFFDVLINAIRRSIENNQYFSYRDILKILLEGKNKLLRENTLRRKMLLYTTFYKIYCINSESFRGGLQV